MAECKIVKGGEGFHGKQGLDYFAGISSESVGSKAICMHMLVMPPGAEAKPHYHESHETAIYMLEGVTEFKHGPNLENVDRWKQATMSISQPGCLISHTIRLISARSRSLLEPIPMSKRASS